MKMQDTIRIEAGREAVFEALNDPDVLRRSIPGCETLEKTADDEMTATVKAKIGPVKATFKGEVKLSDIDPPNGYRISGEGKGGAAGFAKGGATVKLTGADGATDLHYDVDATVGGKLAQLGSRLVDGVAKNMARDFFASFKEIVEGPGEAEDNAPADAAPDAAAMDPAAAAIKASVSGINWRLVGLGVIIAILLVYLVL